MTVAIQLSEQIVEAARPHAQTMGRTIPKQIEYWARLGKAAEENPEMPLAMVLDTLVALEESRAGLTKPYTFG